MIMEYCELVHQDSLSLLEMEWLIEVNLAIIYLLTIFYIQNNSDNYCKFYVRSLQVQIYKEIKKRDFCETCTS